MDPRLVKIAPDQLEIHPILDGFPDLAPDQYASLKNSIAEQGVKVELRGVETPEGRISIYAGRHRRKAAIETNQAEVPVLVNGIADDKLMEFVLDEVTTGRQLTKSGLVLVLFEKHPGLAKERSKRKGGAGKHRKNQLVTESPVNGEDSFGSVAQRYQLPKRYFILLAEIHAAVSSEDWLAVRKAILEDEIAITRIVAGQAGRSATKGKHRAEPTYLILGENGKLGGLMPEALTSLTNGFSHWSKLDLNARAALKTEWDALMENVPEDLR